MSHEKGIEAAAEWIERHADSTDSPYVIAKAIIFAYLAEAGTGNGTLIEREAAARVAELFVMERDEECADIDPDDVLFFKTCEGIAAAIRKTAKGE